MRAIMYHYVRPSDPALPYFRHLEVERFREHLDLLSAAHRWVSRQEMIEAVKTGHPVEDGVILTFDDGFIDHYRFVFPELVKRDIPGIFYLTTQPLLDGKLLEVHQVHLILGRHGGKRVFEWLQGVVSEEMLSHKHVAEFFSGPYRFQTNDEWTVEVKRTLNYLIDYAVRPRVMAAMVKKFLPDESELARGYYLNSEQAREMHDAGMIMGSHTVTHPCMSKLNGVDQEAEIRESFEFLQRILGQFHIKTFCYPYGGSHTFTRETERLLQDAGCLFSFSVDYRDITCEDLRARPQALPRYDCNRVPQLVNSKNH